MIALALRAFIFCAAPTKSKDTEARFNWLGGSRLYKFRPNAVFPFAACWLFMTG